MAWARVLGVLMGLGGALWGDVKSVSLKVSRTSGVAPLPVFFDATGTLLDSGDLHAARFVWDFGDPGSSHPGAVGFTAAHVFERPGVYTVRLFVRDVAGPEVVAVRKIVVLPFSGKTFYVSSSRGSDSNDGRSPQKPFRSFDHAMAVLQAELNLGPAPVRILFRRGDTFRTAGGVAFRHYAKGRPVIFGAYGDGPKPVIQNTGGDEDYTFVFAYDNAGFRWMDLELVGGYDFRRDKGPATTHIYLTDRARDFLLLRVTARNSGQLFVVGGRVPDKEELFVVDCVMREFEGVGVYIAGKYVAVLGTILEKSSYTHCLRVWFADRAVVAGNVLRFPSANYPARGRHALKLHGDSGGGSGRTRYVTVADNVFEGSAWSVVVGPQDNQSREYVEDVVIERNTFYAEATTRRTLMIMADRVTVRNNLFLARPGAAADPLEFIVLSSHPLLADPEDVRIWHNTAVDLRADARTVRFLELGAPRSRRVSVQNNLFYAPAKTGSGTTGIRFPGRSALQGVRVDHNLWWFPKTAGRPVAWDVAGGKGYDLAAWQKLGQGTGSLFADPLLTAPAAGCFYLRAGSPAVDAGAALPAVFEDMKGTARPAGRGHDLGAFEQAAQGSGGVRLDATPRAPRPGQGVLVSISAPSMPRAFFQVGLSLRAVPPLRHGRLVIPLGGDPLLRLTAQLPLAPPAWQLLGRLDGRGEGRAAVRLPAAGALSGIALYCAALVWAGADLRVSQPLALVVP